MEDFRNIRKILLIHLRLIGDVLLSTPVFRALKHRFPDAEVSALVNPGTEAMLRGNPNVAKVFLPPRSKGLISRIPAELRLLRDIRTEGFDMAVSLTTGDRAAIAAFASGARYRLSYDPAGSGLPGKRLLYTHTYQKRPVPHRVIRMLDLLEQAGIHAEDTSVDFIVSDADRERAPALLARHGRDSSRPLVHIHPLSRMAYKCWKDEYMADIIAWLTRQGAQVVLTASPAPHEIQHIADILSHIPTDEQAHVINLAGKVTLHELGAVSGEAMVFFGVDSAPMHIAAAVGTTVVALFGAGHRSWAPWGENHIVISNEFTDKAVPREERVQRNLSLITPDEVKEKLAPLIRSGSTDSIDAPSTARP
jgi:heptosyltransferase-3